MMTTQLCNSIRFYSILSFIMLCSFFLQAQFNPSLIGNASSVGNDCYQITPNLNGQSGAIWSPDRINMRLNFIIEFRIFLGTNDANGADGLTFVMKNSPNPVIGNLGGGMGYEGITNSFAIEFDTWQNTDLSDPFFDHIAMVSAGINDHSMSQNLAGPIVASPTSNNVEDGVEHAVRIEWDGTAQTMSIYFDCDLRLTYTGDLINQVFGGSTFSYFGFTGSTGGAANLQRVCFDYISFANDLGVIDDTAICIGDTVSNVDATINGASSYLWTPATGVSNPNIPNPTFSPSTTTTYNIDITNSCGDVIQEDFTISVGSQPTANTVADFNVCDDASNDGIITYDLLQLDAAVIGTQDPTLFTVSYYASQIDADAATNPLPQNFSNTAICERIYSRIESVTSSSCYNTTDFELCVSTQPVANPVATYRLCDDISNNNSEVFDLVSRIPEVLLGQVPADFNIEYFTTQAEADQGSVGGATPVSNMYSSGGQTMYVRIENIANTDCFDTTFFDIIVDDLPLATAPADLVICDDMSNDGTEDITLSQFDADVLNGQTSPNFVVSYHANQTDADNGTPELTSPFTITTGTTTIFARIDNSDNETCASTTPINIVLNEQAVANSVAEYRICDDSTNDGLEDFDLSTRNAAVLFGQNPANFTIEYFTSQADADLGSAGGATPLPTIYNSGSTTLFVRIETNSNSSCYDTEMFDIFVDPLPRAGTPTDIIVCDDPSNDGTENVDLSQFDMTILDGQTNPSFNVTYHATQTDADNNASPLASPYTVTSATPNIFARIDNADNDTCYTTTTFRFVISPTPTANAVQDMITCDDPGNDGSEIFDLTMANSEVLDSQNPTDFNITYHTSLNGAQTGMGTDQIANDTAYASSTTTPETIFVRIEAVANPVCADTTSFTLTVSEQPTAGTAIDLVGCDDISNDGFEEFDFTSQDASIYNGQSTADFNVTYHTSQADADNDTGALSFPYTNVSRAQTIYARIENASNQDCYDVSTFRIEVFARPTIANQGPYTICAGVPETIDAGPGYSSYLWSTGEMTQTIDVSSGDDYTVTVTNSDGCDSTATITVVESDVAVIERIDVGQFEVNTNTLTAIVTGSGDYEFSLDNFVYQDSQRFTNLYPGFYTIYVRDKNGCGTVSMDAVIIGGPPYFTPNQDGYHDTWQVIAVSEIPDASIYIFDRYGKLLKQISATGPGWDGTYNGNPMPSSDYWYLVELTDGRSFKGHFALKR
ncbi:lectin-like domain-containing protein [Nonlabens dokdonensis]|nr:T9SS type B sorting domain-containing protein [Nonlabens dokdonensis]